MEEDRELISSINESARVLELIVSDPRAAITELRIMAAKLNETADSLEETLNTMEKLGDISGSNMAKGNQDDSYTATGAMGDRIRARVIRPDGVVDLPWCNG